MITINEAKKIIDQFLLNGYTEEELLRIFYLMYSDKKISFDELEALVDVMGYELTKEFLDSVKANPSSTYKQKFEDKKFTYKNTSK